LRSMTYLRAFAPLRTLALPLFSSYSLPPAASSSMTPTSPVTTRAIRS
jgi:hypothetical protein